MPSADAILNVILSLILMGLSALVWSLRGAITGGVDVGKYINRLSTVEQRVESIAREQRQYCTRRELEAHMVESSRDREQLRRGQEHLGIRVDAILSSLGSRGELR